MKRKLVIATRGSRLALTQSEWVASQLRNYWHELEIDLRIIKTTGDRLQTESLPGTVLSKGLFTKEIEQELLENRADLAVHSCKDLPVEGPEGLTIGAVPPRALVYDVLILKKGLQPDSLPPGAIIYSGSLRREYQWLAKHPGTVVEPIRGNVDTRVQKLKANPNGHGLLLAAAGLARLGLKDPDVDFFDLPLEWMLPAPAQGALAVQIRSGDSELAAVLQPLNHEASRRAIDAERSFLQAMGGGCQAPLGAFAEQTVGEGMRLSGVYFSSGKEAGQRHSVSGDGSDPLALGKKLAECFQP